MTTQDRTVTEAYHAPGNATLYHLLLIEPVAGAEPLYVFAWLNAPGGGRAMLLHKHGCVHIGYLAEKLRYTNEGDLKPLLRWLAQQGMDCYID